MNKDKVMDINVLELTQKTLGSFSDIYGKLALIQNRLKASATLSKSAKTCLENDYKIFRNEVARRVENCRQITYKHYKYDAWHQEIKSLYEKLPPTLDL